MAQIKENRRKILLKLKGISRAQPMKIPMLIVANEQGGPPMVKNRAAIPNDNCPGVKVISDTIGIADRKHYCGRKGTSVPISHDSPAAEVIIPASS